MIRTAQPNDCTQLCDIYNYYITATTITFEEEVVSVDEFKARLNEISGHYPYLVYEENGEILGYAYATSFRKRSAYRHTTETSVYVHKDHFKKGIGIALYQDLLDALKAANFKTAIGGITLPNAPSVAFHERFGFEKVGHFKKVGYKFDQWLDVGFWQLTLND